jgi:Cft2 family RNA processing exonuclease
VKGGEWAEKAKSMWKANHCPGAVMFLIEGDGKAVLNTGDIRGKSIYKYADH